MQNTIGERIINLRKQKGLTQLQLAEILKISDKAVSKWESNKGDPSLEMLILLSETFNCTTDYLIKGIIHNNTKPKNISINPNDEIPYCEDLFYRAIDIVKNNVSAISYEMWISHMRPLKINDTTLVVIVPSKIIKDHINKIFKEEIIESLQQIDHNVATIHILIDEIDSDKNLKEEIRYSIINNGVNASRLQSFLMIGYPTANDIITSMEYMGYISKNNGHNLRDVLITQQQFEDIFKEPLVDF